MKENIERLQAALADVEHDLKIATKNKETLCVGEDGFAAHRTVERQCGKAYILSLNPARRNCNPQSKKQRRNRMFYKKKYLQAVADLEHWKRLCNEIEDRFFELWQTKRKLQKTCDWLEKENARLRRKDAFTFDKAEFQRLKLENAELRAKLESKGAKK